MYLAQDDGQWTPLNKRWTVSAIRALNEHLKSTLGIDAALTFLGHRETLGNFLRSSGRKRPERPDHSELRVERAHTRPLPFYGDGWVLYRFACVIDAKPELAGYERIAHLFAVRAPGAAQGISPTVAGASAEWTLLDWTSSPLHQLNERVNLELTQENARDYLVFFSSFLGDGENVDYAPTPFLIPQTAEDFFVSDALEPFEEFAQKNNLKWFKPPLGIEDADTVDLPHSAAITENRVRVAAEKSEGDDVNFDVVRRTIEDAFEAVPGGNPPLPGPESAADFHFDGVLVWYRNTLFRSNFVVQLDGTVRMEDDAPIAEAHSLPRLDVRQARRPPVPLLCRESRREEISALKLLSRIRQSFSADGAAGEQQVRLRGLRVTHDVEYTGVFDGAVRLENVEFGGSVKFKDAVFERSVQLVGCRFLEALSTPNTKVKGEFRLDNSECLGALPYVGADRSQPPPETLDLRGLDVMGGLFADNLTVFGGMNAQWARIGGAMRARGLQIHGRQANETQALDFSYAMIDGPLDLVGHAPRRRTLGETRPRRTFIGGVAVMHGLRACQVDLRGIRVEAHLDLESCEISGRADLRVLDFVDGTGAGWRARVGTGLNVNGGRAAWLDLSGSAVGGYLDLMGLRLERWLFARQNGCFRTRVGGEVRLSGATIQSDIDFSGAEIAGRFTFVTGRCGRLKLSAGPWLQPGGTPAIRPTLAEGVLLMDLQVDAGIDVAGLRTVPPSGERGNDAYVGGGFVALGTRLGGGLRFWREDAHAHFHAQFAELREGLDANVIDDAINGICAQIGGKLDLRGLLTAGTINLGRCEVERMIRLENARIGGNLRACGDAVTCSVAEFHADLARIEGDADLSRLEVRGNFSARDGRVDGNVLLPDGVGSARVCGAICLSGLRVGARLVVSGRGLGMNADANAKLEEEVRVDLSRCRIGQLHVREFEPNSGAGFRFGHRINLLAIQVGDWCFDANDNELIRGLLAETKPFDAGNYIDVEQRLARIGYKNLADRVYLDMKNRAYGEMNARHVYGEQSSKPKSAWLKKTRLWSKKAWVWSAKAWHWLKKAWLWSKEAWVWSAKAWHWLKKAWHWLKKARRWLKYRLAFSFSRHGTRPYRMVGWLLLTIFPVVFLLQDHRNVELPFAESAGEHKVKETPVSDGQSNDWKDHWGGIKATGLAVSYAVPFYGGARSETVRARLTGPICCPLKAKDQECESVSIWFIGNMSPHEFAMLMSMIQFILWIVIAANLPTIIRRRS